MTAGYRERRGGVRWLLKMKILNFTKLCMNLWTNKYYISNAKVIGNGFIRYIIIR